MLFARPCSARHGGVRECAGSDWTQRTKTAVLATLCWPAINSAAGPTRTERSRTRKARAAAVRAMCSAKAYRTIPIVPPLTEVGGRVDVKHGRTSSSRGSGYPLASLAQSWPTANSLLARTREALRRVIIRPKRNEKHGRRKGGKKEEEEREEAEADQNHRTQGQKREGGKEKGKRGKEDGNADSGG